MCNLTFITDYKDIDQYRLSFNELANKTFGIDFEKWYQLGFWTDTYICHSYVDGDKIVSNVSVNLLDIIVEGQIKKAVHIGTVMTDPLYRNKGLAGQLMNIVQKKYEGLQDIIYLSPNDKSLKFYLNLGFKPIRDSLYVLDTNFISLKKKPIRRLDISKLEDSALIRRLALERKAISKTFGVINGYHILTWYCVNAFSKDIYYIENEDIIIMYKHVDNALHIYDVIGSGKINMTNILESIAKDTTKKVIFYFTPEFEDLDKSKLTLQPDETYCIKTDSVSIPRYFKYPITALA